MHMVTAGTVFVLHDDRVERAQRQLGAQNSQGQIVLSGIDAGTAARDRHGRRPSCMTAQRCGFRNP